MSDVILNLLPLREEERAAFEAAAPDSVHLYARRSTATPEQYAGADIILGWPRAEMLARAVNLKWFHCMFAGTEMYTKFLPKGALLTSSAGANSRSVAEHLLACLLSLYRKLPLSRDQQREHQWTDVGGMKSLLGETILIVGAGHVGSDFAQLCQAMGAGRVIGLKRNTKMTIPGFDELFTLDRLDELLPQADVVALTLPHSPQTEGLMNGERLSRMKKDAVLLSAGRGSVLDQDALAETMKSGRLWGAALDVTVPEPLPGDSPLWDIPNLILTPHAAGGIRLEITRKNCVELALDNLKRYQAGQPLHNQVSR